MTYHLDCRHFRGEKPCGFQDSCSECAHYAPMGKRILVIKLAAIGDVLRTTPLLRGLKRKYPDSHITWLTDENARPLLANNPFLDRLFTFNLESVLRLEVEKFDLLICLDKEARASALAARVQAVEKAGFALGEQGNIFPLNKESEYAFDLGLSDELKFKKNKKTYPEIIFEMCGIAFENDEYVLEISPEDAAFAGERFKEFGIRGDDFVVGLNTGAGSAFVNKAWPEKRFLELINLLAGKKVKILLLGGPEEIERNRRIMARAGGMVYDTGCGNTLGQFCALLEDCHLIVTGDTTALHIAIALRKLVVALFGPTCPQEIELYGRGKMIVAGIDCAPCYKDQCPRQLNCLELITAGEVFSAVRELRERH